MNNECIQLYMRIHLEIARPYKMRDRTINPKNQWTKQQNNLMNGYIAEERVAINLRSCVMMVRIEGTNTKTEQKSPLDFVLLAGGIRRASREHN